MCKEFFDDSLEGIFAGGVDPVKVAEPVKLIPVAPVTINPYKEVCAKCRGTGRFYSYTGRLVGKCLACNGIGSKSFKTSPETRTNAKVASVARKARTEAENLADFAISNPIVSAWFTGSDFPFAVAMREAVAKYGDLTERQLAAAQNCVAKLAMAKQTATDRVVNAPVIDCSIVSTALNTAKGNGLKNPKLRVSGFTFSLAKDNSANAGAVYVKSGDMYAGKVKDGKFYSVKGIDAEMVKAIVEAASDPRGAAVKHGKLTGNCSCCNRTLTDPVSVANGIGPICAANFGF